MKFDRREWTLFTVVVCALLFLIGFYFGGYHQSYQGTYQHGGQTHDPSPSWTDVAVAVFTAMLTVVAVIQGIQLSASNKVAKGSLDISKKAHDLAVDGLSETKRSVDAYIDAERGRLFVVDILKYQGDFRIDWVLQNIGSGPAILTYVRIDIGMDGTTMLPVRMIKIQRVILSGNFKLTHKDAPLETTINGLEIPIPDAFIEPLLAGSDLHIVFTFRYITIIGRLYQIKMRAIKSISNSGHTWTILEDPKLTNEKLVVQLRSLKKGSRLHI